MSVAPIRVQRSRAKGSRLVSPNGLPVVCVTRGTKWGNPFRSGMLQGTVNGIAGDVLVTKFGAVMQYDVWLRESPDGRKVANDARRELRGKNLACWCKPGDYCHADVLLELANAPALAATATGAGEGKS